MIKRGLFRKGQGEVRTIHLAIEITLVLAVLGSLLYVVFEKEKVVGFGGVEEKLEEYALDALPGELNVEPLEDYIEVFNGVENG